jgi:hypothetical protein
MPSARLQRYPVLGTSVRPVLLEVVTLPSTVPTHGESPAAPLSCTWHFRISEPFK